MYSILITEEGVPHSILVHTGNESIAIRPDYSLLSFAYLEDQAKLLGLDGITEVLAWMGVGIPEGFFDD